MKNMPEKIICPFCQKEVHKVWEIYFKDQMKFETIHLGSELIPFHH